MRRKTAFLVFLGLLCGGTASAQSPSQESGQPESRKEKRIEAEKQEAAAEEAVSQPQTLSLQDAVGFAVEHNKSLKASRLNIELQQKMITEAISAGIPQINANLNYQTNFGQSVSMGETGLSIKMEDNFTLGASASWTVLNGEWIVGIQTAKIAKTLASQQVDADALDIKSTIYNSYYTILVCERLVQILQENLDNMSQILEHTQNMYNAGSVEISDVDQIRITVGQLNNSLLSMERTLDVNYNLLRIQLGLKAGTPITLTDRLDDFLGEEGFANLALKDFDINNNLQYQLTLTQEELQKKAVSAKKWAYAPTLSAGYNYQYQIVSGGFMTIPHTATVTLSVPIFSGLQRKSQLDQEKITLQQTQLNKSLLEDQLRLNEAQYKYDLQNATENFNLQKENVEVAKSVLGHYQAKFNVGNISSLDLTQANNNYLEAENNYTSACLDLLEAQTNLLKLYNELQ
ncbi:MAG: TolC family protein [Bacteroidetes bacterium]|uniref:TolC family protein n=1 Tax=Candidatus Pullibacteroides excrementavium TaxID=2840905 RepID=A0A9D9DQT1_9BACT|nr:TolC family protein [Candidatus Pullibacteroides excrementavium]